MQAISRRLGHQSPFSSSSHLQSIYFLSNDYCHGAADNPRYASTLATKGVGHLVRKDTGGRSSISGNVAAVFGATGFLGRLAKQLATVSAEGECKTNFLRSPFIVSPFTTRCFATMGQFIESPPSASSASDIDPPTTRIKFKRPDKTAKHIMQILDREAVEEVKKQREIPDIRPGYIVQLKVEVPENKRRVSVLKGIVIARRNAGLNTTFRIRRLVAGVGIESLFPLYSPNIKEIKVLDKKKVRRAKLYYLRDKMNALKKQ